MRNEHEPQRSILSRRAEAAERAVVAAMVAGAAMAMIASCWALLRGG